MSCLLALSLRPLTQYAGRGGLAHSHAEMDVLPQSLWRISGPNSGPLGSMVELVKREDDLKHEPPRRGCGCPTPVLVVLTIVLVVVLAAVVVRCEHSPEGSTVSGHDRAIAETYEFLPAEV